MDTVDTLGGVFSGHFKAGGEHRLCSPGQLKELSLVPAERGAI